MPQFDVTTFSSQLFWLASCFFVLLVFSAKVTLPRLGTVLAARWQKTEGTLKEARALNRQAEEMTASYQAELQRAKKRAHGMILERTRQVRESMSQKKEALSREQKKHLSSVERSLAQEKAAAVDEIRTIAQELAIHLVEVLTGSSPDKAALEGALTTSMTERSDHDF